MATTARSFSYDRPTVGIALSYMALSASLGLGMVMAELRRRMHLSGTVTSLHTAFFGWGLVAAGLAGFWIVTKVRRDVLLRVAVAAVALGAVVFSLGQRLPITLLGALIGGVACAMVSMTIPPILADHHGDGYADALAATNAYPALVGVAFPVTLGIALSRGWGWRPVFAPFVVVFAAIALAVLGRPAAARTNRAGRLPVPVSQLLRRPATRNRWLMLVVVITFEFGANAWSVAYLREVGGISSGAATGLFGLIAAGMFVIRLAYPAVTRDRPAHVVEGVAALVSACGLALVWNGPSPVVRALGLLVQGVGLAVLYPLGVARLYDVTDADSESLGALAALATGVAISIGPMLIGSLADAVGLRWAYLSMPLLGLMAAGVNLRSRARWSLALH